MTDAAPLQIIRTYTPPSTVATLRLAMVGAALAVAALAFAYPLLTGAEDTLLTAVFLGVAALDLVLAAFLPALLGRLPGPLHYALYADRIDIVPGLSGRGGVPVATVPFSVVARVEELDGISDRDRAAGFTGLRIILREDLRPLARFAHYDRRATALTLRGLHNVENPFPSLKLLVEKSGRA
jgi:hypothetical protein